jgi:hypothetical protein
METRQFEPDGYCGLYCGACPKYLETKEGAAPATSDQSVCFGCKTDVNPKWCLECKIKACAREKNVSFCHECSDYPCSDLEAFKNDSRYPYHQEVTDYMTAIAAEGKEAWLERMKTRWCCPSCKRESSWWDLSCKGCGAGVKGYERP